MKQRVMNFFQGITPRYSPDLKSGWAVEAENVDLSSTKIRSLAAPLAVQADVNLYNSLFNFNDAWEMGNDRHYLSWKIADADLLFYLAAGVPYKKIGDTAVPLGQTRLGAPTLAENGAGALNDTFYYIMTTTRNVAGHIDESGPSTLATITVSSKRVLVTRPTITDAYVTHWNIYRMSDSSTAYQFVATVAAATATYDDNRADAVLGASPTTWYTSDQGNSIIFDIPQETFDGIINKPFTGMLFFWKDSTLYWTEPGYPDAMPSFYNMNFPSAIKRVVSFAGTVAVLCETGPYRVDGTHPELLQQSEVLGTEPCIGTAACATSKGVAFLSDSGVVLFNLIETEVVSDDAFTENWFKENIAAAGAFMIENDGIIYLFHSAGVLAADTRTSPWIWTTLDIIGFAAYRDFSTGEIYYIDAAGVQKLFGADASMTWTWKSGNILGSNPKDKQFDGVEFTGSGAVTASLYVDGILKATKALGFTNFRNRTLKLPEHTQGRALQIAATGTGTIDEMMVSYE